MSTRARVRALLDQVGRGLLLCVVVGLLKRPTPQHRQAAPERTLGRGDSHHHQFLEPPSWQWSSKHPSHSRAVRDLRRIRLPWRWRPRSCQRDVGSRLRGGRRDVAGDPGAGSALDGATSVKDQVASGSATGSPGSCCWRGRRSPFARLSIDDENAGIATLAVIASAFDAIQLVGSLIDRGGRPQHSAGAHLSEASRLAAPVERRIGAGSCSPPRRYGFGDPAQHAAENELMDGAQRYQYASPTYPAGSNTVVWRIERPGQAGVTSNCSHRRPGIFISAARRRRRPARAPRRARSRRCRRPQVVGTRRPRRNPTPPPSGSSSPRSLQNQSGRIPAGPPPIRSIGSKARGRAGPTPIAREETSRLPN